MEIKIGGYKVKITFQDGYQEETGNYGIFLFATQEIIIENNLSKQHKEEIVLHEILEAIKFIYDIKISHNQLDLLGVILHQILKDNKELWEYLSS